MGSLVSVIIPVYNIEKYLDECIQSVVNQTYGNLEIILVDDGSTDESPKMCDLWAERDSRVRVIHQQNGGASSARNRGLDEASGEFITFADSDDVLASDAIEKMVAALVDTSKSMVCVQSCRFSSSVPVLEENKHNERRTVLNLKDAIDDLLFYSKTAVWGKMFAKNVFDGVRFPLGETNEDVAVIVPLYINANGIVLLDEVLYFYRSREGSVTASSIYHKKEYSSLVHKNLGRVKQQLTDAGIPCGRAYKCFCAESAFYSALSMEKKYGSLDDDVKKDYKIYRALMRRNCMSFLFSSTTKFKDKLLYSLVLTKLLRPLYKCFYKKHI